ncbi:MAG: hypothetical protein NW215_00265 [Hyphomicrobiales bacterium]|nr:hypothetical protein [Hyphomicrobiales bacterium]
MDTKSEWRHIGSAASGVMQQLAERRREQQRFIEESRAEVASRYQSRPALRGQLELPLPAPMSASFALR